MEITEFFTGTVPKGGNDDSANDDRWLYREDKTSIRRKAYRVAVADGATESAFSGLWAHKLVKQFVESNLKSAELPALPELASEWSKEVWAKNLPWYTQEKVQQGAFSTFLGLCLTDGKRKRRSAGKYSAIAVGDTCLFQVRQDNCINQLPKMRSDEFGNHPQLVSTNPESNGFLHKQTGVMRPEDGTWDKGDRFFLMTDALAHWFVCCMEAGKPPWRDELAPNAFPEGNRFTEWVWQLRRDSQIRNDDVTLVMFTVE